MVVGMLACQKPLQPAEDAPPAAQSPQAHPQIRPAAPDADAQAVGLATADAVADPHIAGHIEVSTQMQAHIKPGDTIYLIARDLTSNSMVAALRLAAPKDFPLPFVLSRANAMMGRASFAGRVHLTARVDKDGDPMSKNKGDVVGEVPQPVDIPSSNIVLVLDKQL